MRRSEEENARLDAEAAERRKKALEALNVTLGKHGWEFVSTKTAGFGVIRYTIRRLADGRTAHLDAFLYELLGQNDLIDAAARDAGYEGMSVTLVIRLLLLAQAQNREHPVAPTPESP